MEYENFTYFLGDPLVISVVIVVSLSCSLYYNRCTHKAWNNRKHAGILGSINISSSGHRSCCTSGEEFFRHYNELH